MSCRSSLQNPASDGSQSEKDCHFRGKTITSQRQVTTSVHLLATNSHKSVTETVSESCGVKQEPGATTVATAEQDVLELELDTCEAFSEGDESPCELGNRVSINEAEFSLTDS